MDSVFEVNVDIDKIKRLENELEKTMNKEIDSIRLYKISQRSDDIKILGKAEKVESLKNNSFIL